MGFALKSSVTRLCSRLLLVMLVISMVLPARAFAEFTIADEIELGNKFNILIRSQMPIIYDPEVVDYMNYLMDRFQKAMPPQPVKFQLHVIRDDTLNAFAVPGGYIFIHSGLITAMSSEAELSGVLAHEMAHVTQRHIASRMEKAKYGSVLALAGMLAGALVGGEAGMAAAMGGMAATQAAMLNYSRADESEADQVGMGYYIAAGYPPEGMVDAFRVIQRPQWVTGGEIPAYLSTHPAVTERIGDLSSRAKSIKVPPENRKPVDNTQFLRVQTLLRGRYSNTEAADKYFQQQLKGENKALAWLGLGILRERQHRINEASHAFSEALRMKPKDQMFLREAGRFNYFKGDRDKAINYLQQATAQNPHDYMAMFFYARLLDDYGQSELALSYYRQVLRYYPEDAEVHEYYARALGKQKQLFPAYLHLAYSSLYANQPGKTEQAYQKVKGMAQTTTDQRELEIFEKKYAERKVFWR